MATTAAPVNPPIPDLLEFVKQFLDARFDQFSDGIAAANAIVRLVEATYGRLSHGERVRLEVYTCASFNGRRQSRNEQ